MRANDVSQTTVTAETASFSVRNLLQIQTAQNAPLRDDLYNYTVSQKRDPDIIDYNFGKD